MDLRRPIKYQWRLFLPLVVLLWTLIATLAIYTYRSEKEFREKHLNEDLRLINSRVINAYENDMELKPFMNFISQYYEKSEFNGIRMSVYQEDGTLLYCIGTPIPTHIDGEYTPEFAKMLDKGYGTSFRRSSVEDDNPYYFFGVLKSADDKIFVLTAMPYTETLVKAMAVDKGIWLVFVPVALIVTLFAYLSTRYLGKNVALLHSFASKAAAGADLTDDEQSFPHDELGDISRKIVSLYKDKTEAIERSEREHRIALKANEEKMRVTKQLANNINHELKTPVGVIKGYLDTLAGHPEMDEASRERFIEKAQGHMSRLCNMLNDLSSITRLEEGGAGVMKERVDFYDLLSNVSAEIESIKLNNGVRFEFDVPIDCYVLGNYNLLYGMVVNLIRNADFHSKGTMCAIKLIGDNSREYRFSFYDDGTGVGEEHLPHLFDRFYRIDKGRSRKVGGTGLGLPIVKNTVLVMGGTIKVRNRQPHGLEFVFSLSKWMSASGKA